MLNIFLQTNDLLLLSELCTYYEHHSIPLPTANNTLDRRSEPFKLPKTRTEKRRGEFVFRTSRVANRIDHLVDFRIEQGLKQRITTLMWKFYSEQYSSLNLCTWQICCDCTTCKCDIRPEAVLIEAESSNVFVDPMLERPPKELALLETVKSV